MKLSDSDKLILLTWMKTKLSFRALIARFGEEKVLAYYLKDKSEKRLKDILLLLKTRKGSYQKKSFNPNKKMPITQVVTRVLNPEHFKFYALLNPKPSLH